MNRYIITEEQLQSVERDGFSNRLFRDFRSNPYQSERDKVLDVLLEISNKRIWFNDIDKPIWLVPISVINEKIEELRQQAGEK